VGQEGIGETYQMQVCNCGLIGDVLILAKPGDIYAVYPPDGGTTNLNLAVGNYTVRWYNPRLGGKLWNGLVFKISGPETVCLGNPPDSIDKDWAILIKSEELPGQRI